jgi:hypothetical protein
MTLRDPEPLYSKAMEMPHLTMLVSERDHMYRQALINHPQEGMRHSTCQGPGG